MSRSHRQDPNEDDLPKPEVTRPVMIAGDVGVAFEETFADAEDIKAAEEYDHEQEAEDKTQRRNGIAMAMKDSK